MVQRVRYNAVLGSCMMNEGDEDDAYQGSQARDINKEARYL